MRLPRVTPEAYRKVTLAALLALCVIIVTGAAVRLTGSGLGCPKWPNCESGSLAPRDPTDGHAMVEFVNRTITGLVSVAVALAVLGSLRRAPRRRDLTVLSLGLVGGVIAQVLLGAITVWTHLTPQIVMAHLLVSLLLVANAVALHHRASPETAPRLVDPAVATVARWLLLAGAVVVVTGTIVTGSGPHGGDAEVRRLPFVVGEVARVHSVAVWILVGLTLVALRRDSRARTLLTVEVAAGRGRLHPVLHGCARGARRGPRGGGGRRLGRPLQVRDRNPRPPARHRRPDRIAVMRLAAPGIAPVEVDRPTSDEDLRPDRPWIVLVWNDPINLMSYVTFVLQKLFGYSYEKATLLMLDVHHKGRAVVSSGSREKAELDVFRLHEHGLWATMQRDD